MLSFKKMRQSVLNYPKIFAPVLQKAIEGFVVKETQEVVLERDEVGEGVAFLCRQHL